MSVERDRRGNGWIARWREHSRQRSRKFALKGDAEAFEWEVKRRQQLGPLVVQQLTARGGPTLDQWVEQRWIPEHASGLARSTCQRYANVNERHIVRALGDVALGALTVARLRDWQASLLRQAPTPAPSTRRARCSRASCATQPKARRNGSDPRRAARPPATGSQSIGARAAPAPPLRSSRCRSRRTRT